MNFKTLSFFTFVFALASCHTPKNQESADNSTKIISVDEIKIATSMTTTLIWC